MTAAWNKGIAVRHRAMTPELLKRKKEQQKAANRRYKAKWDKYHPDKLRTPYRPLGKEVL